MRIPAMIIAALLALPACSEPDETYGITTRDIYVELRAEAGEAGTHVSAALRVGFPLPTTYVTLTGEDTLIATADGETKELTLQLNGGNYRYAADFNATAEDTEVEIRFDREVEEDAPSSRCTLPGPVTIMSPADGEVVRRADQDLVITWAPSGSSSYVDISVEGTCFADRVVSFENDRGTYTVPAGILTSFGNPPESCEATVTLTRINEGTRDQAFANGPMVCAQVRTTTFRSDP